MAARAARRTAAPHASTITAPAYHARARSSRPVQELGGRGRALGLHVAQDDGLRAADQRVELGVGHQVAQRHAVRRADEHDAALRAALDRRRLLRVADLVHHHDLPRAMDLIARVQPPSGRRQLRIQATAQPRMQPREAPGRPVAQKCKGSVPPGCGSGPPR